MVRSIPKIHKDSFRMPDMKVTIRFWGKSSPNVPSSCSEVGFTKVWMDLGITTWFVELTKETLLENRLS